MGSTDHRQGLARVGCLGYATPMELAPLLPASLEEQERTPGARDLQPNTMAARARSGGELPLEELLALYGYDMSHPVLQQQPQAGQTATTLPETTVDKIAKDLFSGEEDEDTRSSADDLTASVTSHAADLVRCHIKVSTQDLPVEDKESAVSSSEEDSDGTSIPSNDGRKDIMVGPQYQACIPLLSSTTCCERAGEGEDQLLWTPAMLSSPAVEEFLLQAQRRLGGDVDRDTLTPGDPVKDNEQALYELVKCNFNTEEALRRLCFNVKVFSEELCAWSEEECRNFEHGYRVHGKNFHLIQANKVRTRSVGECVEYYYMWKKSERHEYFTQQSTKLGRRKYALQSGNMEDGDGDVEHGEVDGSSLQLRPPSPPPALQVEQQAAQREIREKELCADPHSSLQREQLHSCFPTQRPTVDRLSPDSVAAPPCIHPYACAHPPQQDSDYLGSGLYHIHLGSYVGNGAPACSPIRPSGPHQTGFSFPHRPAPPPAITPSTAVPDFDAMGGLLCPSSALCPAQQPHPLMQ
ncbi:mesoderm induction early response protein 2 isoform X2 [Brachyhypopomus gauderio]|uniref:mesoderm induction early response protein 2 isoform X2 n=1 Tax=Brachyhypopomus gauderio TaxID=698409 RepID=UPI004042EEC5